MPIFGNNCAKSEEGLNKIRGSYAPANKIYLSQALSLIGTRHSSPHKIDWRCSVCMSGNFADQRPIGYRLQESQLLASP
jgi:hypothetical protein